METVIVALGLAQTLSSSLVFEKGLLRISAGTPAILTLFVVLFSLS
jgi:hypothetical protein